MPTKAIGIDLTPEFEVENLSMAVPLVGSTGGFALMPLHARNLLPPTVTSRELAGTAPTIHLSVGDNASTVSTKLSDIVDGIVRLGG